MDKILHNRIKCNKCFAIDTISRQLHKRFSVLDVLVVTSSVLLPFWLLTGGIAIPYYAIIYPVDEFTSRTTTSRNAS